MTSVHSQAQALLGWLVSQSSPSNQDFGTMSSSIYDTAWLSMLQRPGEREGEWLFPQCFDYVLENQLPDGGWESSATTVDGILNTAAALLSLSRHVKANPERQDLQLRIRKAETALARLLESWDVISTDQVGFELLIVKHLDLLADQGVMVDLQFTSRPTLQALYDSKLARIPFGKIHKGPSTICHSLEALIGHVNFDQMGCWLEPNGSMMGSPSSTAAYLMYASRWDDRAESYLRAVLTRPRHGNGEQDGRSVPCAWPTSVFEVSWAITTLIDAGVSIKRDVALALGNFLEQSLEAKTGVVGFAPFTLPDADDTAKALVALFHLKRSSISLQPLIETFQGDCHFHTYQGERNPSFSANCNVLICLLTIGDPMEHVSEIAKATRFVCERSYMDQVNEKWHIHELYWMMLLTQGFVALCDRMRNHDALRKILFKTVPEIEHQVPMISLHLLTRLLNSQNSDGSWGKVCEITAYAILSLVSLSRLSWISELGEKGIAAAVSKGKRFLDTHRDQWSQGGSLWVEKVTYSSSLLSEVYCIAAALAEMVSQPRTHVFPVPDKITARGMRQAGELIVRTPLLAIMPTHTRRIAELQACYALGALRRRKEPFTTFPREGPNGSAGDAKYMVLIPLVLATCNALQNPPLPLSVLHEMAVLSLLVYRADEYIEGVVERHLEFKNLQRIATVIKDVISRYNQPASNSTNGSGQENGVHDTPPPFPLTANGMDNKVKMTLQDAEVSLDHFAVQILTHPAVQACPTSVQAHLALELETFLLAHVTHAEDNRRFHDQKSKNSLYDSPPPNAKSDPGINPSHLTDDAIPPVYSGTPGRSFYSWVRSTSADHTSCPFSFIFFHCLVSMPSLTIQGAGCPGSTPISEHVLSLDAGTAYIAQDVCRHLSSLCRMYNDWGSVERDLEEGNLSSMNFAEFQRPKIKPLGEVRGEVMWIAEYERRGLEAALRELEVRISGYHNGTTIMHAVRFFIHITDLYGQIYVIKDHTNRVK